MFPGLEIKEPPWNIFGTIKSFRIWSREELDGSAQTLSLCSFPPNFP